MITCIAAMNRFGTIGLDGKMPWHNIEDLKHFKAYTMGKTLLMGRVTFEGLPKKLKGRKIVVLSRNVSYPNGVSNLEKFLEQYRNSNEELVVCGGAHVYNEVLPYANKLVLSFIHESDILGDTFFPKFTLNDYKIVSRKTFRTFTNIVYERK